jgi:hypothetical protein
LSNVALSFGSASERAAPVTGSDEDFVFLITLACTGMRWAEAIGMEQDCLLLSLINVEWQLHEITAPFGACRPRMTPAAVRTGRRSSP